MPVVNHNRNEQEKELSQLKQQPSISWVLEQRNGPLRIEIPQKLLVQWGEIRSRLPHIQFLELFKHCSSHLPIDVKPGTDRLEERLRVITSLATNQVRGIRGSQRIKLLEKRRTIDVYPEELINVSSIRRQVEILEQENESLKERLKELDERCDNLLEEILMARKETEDVAKRAQVLESELQECKEQNEQLREYICHLEDGVTDPSFENTGKPISDVGNRQKIRKMKQLTTNVEKALWFVDSFGLKLDSLTLVQSETQRVQLQFGGKGGKKSVFSQLSEDEKDKIRSILFVMDRFCISDAAYHELTMQVGELERSYLVRQCRSDLNKLVHITRTPGLEPGVQMSFKEELTYQLEQKMAKEPFTKAKIRIGGDGAKMSRISNFVVLSFCMLDDEESVMSAYVVSGKEDYNNIKVACSEVFKEINDLVDANDIEVKGNNICLDFYLSGDYKFLLLVLGLNAANSVYACIYCKIPNIDRWDISKPEDHYCSKDMMRTLDEMKAVAGKSKDNFGCIYPPLLKIPLENIRIDELHLLLRITDKLEKNLILSSIERDNICAVDSIPGSKTHLEKLVNAICDCGVAFSVWQKRNGDDTLSGQYDWTSMVGGEKKKVLRNLPDKFDTILDQKNCQKIKKLWQDFGILYDTITSENPTEEMRSSYFGQAKEWIKLFNSLGEEESGYGKGKVTPYMHIMCYHIPQFLKSEIPLKRFTGQGIEKINDITRSIYHNKSNKHDACCEALQAIKRIDRLQMYERDRHQYTKKKEEYWSRDIFERRYKRIRLGVAPRDDFLQSVENTAKINSLTMEEVKEKLSSLGVKTRLRSLKKLRELLNAKLSQ